MSHIEKEKLIKADIASIENRVRHAFNQGYDLGFKDGKERAKAQELTIKNNLRVDAISRADAIRVASGYCHPSNVAKELAKLPSVTPQEPVLDKIKGQIEDYLHGVEITLEVLVENDPLRPKMEGAKYTLEECLELINKAETEDTDGTNK